MRAMKKVLAGMLAAAMTIGGTLAAGAAGGIWVQDNTGWWYQNADGTWPAAKWMKDTDGRWYRFNASGYMQTGWIQEGNTWYYLNPKADGTQGSMKTGWILDKGVWYYLNPVSDGTQGAMKTGWLELPKGTWYYLSTASGAMLENTWVTTGSTRYYIGAGGVWNGSSEVVMVSSSGSSNSSNNNNNSNNDVGGTGIPAGDFGSGSTVEVDGDATTVTNGAGDKIVVSGSGEGQTVTVTVPVAPTTNTTTISKVSAATTTVSSAVGGLTNAAVAGNPSDAEALVKSNADKKVAIVLPEVSGSSMSKQQSIVACVKEGTTVDDAKASINTVVSSITSVADNSKAAVVYNGVAYSKTAAGNIVDTLGVSGSGTVSASTKKIYVLMNGEYIEYTIDTSLVN